MLRARVITALILVVGWLMVLFAAPSAVVGLVFAAVVGLAAWEWAGLMKLGATGRVLYALVLVAVCAVIRDPGKTWLLLWLTSAAFWLIAAPLWLMYRWRVAALPAVGAAVGAILLVPTWAAMMELYTRSPWWLLGVMALIWVADIGAYFSGRAFGRHKLAPAISPGKTWEGVAGGFGAVAVYVAIVGAATGQIAVAAWPAAIFAAILLAAISIVGDLFESLFKRQAEVKDSSHLLPGHGGILDRIDSLTAALPLAALATMGVGL